jgi:hypothetical protein
MVWSMVVTVIPVSLSLVSTSNQLTSFLPVYRASLSGLEIQQSRQPWPPAPSLLSRNAFKRC